ncbi:hypothetical protein ACWD4V_01285 [Streptomyces tsukubensis]
MRRRLRRTERAAPPVAADPVLDECRDFVDSLDLPVVERVRDLCDYVAELIGEPIHLRPGKPAGAGTACGMAVRGDGKVCISYDPDSSPAHQDHIIAHELGHLLKGHVGVPQEQKGVVLGDLDPDLMFTVLTRTNYDEIEEKEAEGIADLLEARLTKGRPAPQSETADRITRTLMRRTD